MGSKEMQYFMAFKDVCKKINSSLDVGKVLNSITENAVKLPDVKGSMIFLLDKEQKILNVSASHGLSDTFINKGSVDAEKSMEESLRGKSVLVIDVTKDSRIQYPDEAKKEGVASILSVPMSVKENIIGVLRIYTSKSRQFSDIEMEFISGLADMGGIAIENAKMYNHLESDYKTLMSDVHMQCFIE